MTSITSASNGKRFAAYLIDIIPLVLIVYGLFYIYSDFELIQDQYLQDKSDYDARAAFLKKRNYIRYISLLLWVTFSIFMDASTWQGTWGKKLFNIKVVDEDGERLSLSHSVKRNLAKVVSIVPVFIGFIWVFFDSKNRGLHDKIANTRVIQGS